MKFPWSSALVTGASSGIGEAIVRQLAREGVPVVVVARRTDRLNQLAAELPGIEVLSADLLTEEGLQLVSARLADADHSIDLLVNNAGFGTSGKFADLDGVRLGQEVDLNVRAVVRLASAASKSMVARRRGWIMNVSSVASFQPGPSLAVYSATKAFVTSFSEAIHEELRASNVKVTALCPGLTKTEFQSVSNTTGVEARVPSFAWLSAEQVAREGLADTARGRALSIPGATYKALVAGTSMVPRSLKRRGGALFAAFNRDE